MISFKINQILHIMKSATVLNRIVALFCSTFLYKELSIFTKHNKPFCFCILVFLLMCFFIFKFYKDKPLEHCRSPPTPFDFIKFQKSNGGIKVKNYRSSDYAANKYSDGIVYRFSNKTVEVTLQDYLMENPHKTEEDFKELKRLSDEMFKEQVKRENADSYHCVSSEEIEDIAFQNQSLIDDYIEKLDKRYSYEALKQLFQSGILTDTQKRRFVLYIFKGLSLRQIAELEGTSHQAIHKSIIYCTKKLKNIFNL